MKLAIATVVIILATNISAGAPTQTSSKKTTTSPPQASPKKTTQAKTQPSSTRRFGESYATLRPQQKKLIDDLVRRYNQTTGSKIVAQQGYDSARVSIRTTFDAVTHALLNATLTDDKGANLGHAIDQVDAIDAVMGEEQGERGDRQFRLYVYLKPTAFNTLSKSREFYRDHDNTVYHKGFPTCFRLKNGPPSIQVSMSRDHRMADIDVDYRSSTFPKALFNGHLSASNSDVRAGNNLDTHDGRWSGLVGWWRDVFGSLGKNTKPPKDEPAKSSGQIPLSPAITADKGIAESAHDFLKSWIVDKQPNNSIAYFSRRSYPCLEAMARKNRKPIPPGMVRVRIRMAMEKYIADRGAVDSVGDAFEAAQNWQVELKEAKNSYAAEFRLVVVPTDVGDDMECAAPQPDAGAKKSKEKYYATAFRGKQGTAKVMSLLWAQEGKYWKIVAIRVEDSNHSDIIPKMTEAAPSAEVKPEEFTGDAKAVKDITDFYQTWIGKRDAAQAARYASERSYQCLGTAATEAEKKMKPIDRIRAGLERALSKIQPSASLSGMMSSVEPVNELVRPVEQENSKAFSVMAIPDQKADSYLCRKGHVPEKTPDLKPSDAKYGKAYLSASQFNFGDEESPTLLLLWSQERDRWKVVAWAIEVP